MNIRWFFKPPAINCGQLKPLPAIDFRVPHPYNSYMDWRKIFGNFPANVFLGLYIIAFPFHRAVWKLPFFKEKIQPAEFSLAILALYFFYLLFSRRIKYWFSPFDIPAILWLLANIISNALVGFNDHLLLETVKVLAVVLIYFLFRLLMNDSFLDKLTDIFLFSALITSLLAISGSWLSFFGIQTVWVAEMQTYPYIGKIGRAMAFTSTPNMLGSILMVALLLKFTQLYKRKAVKKSEIVILSLCFLAFFIAISKTILCFLFGFMALIFLFSKKRTILFKTFICGSMAFLSLVYLIGSHFVFTFELSPRVLDNMKQGHITRSVHNIGPLIAIETSYLTIKSSCLQMVKISWPWGIGTRNFKLQVPQLKEAGLYNKETMAFDPHCTPLGAITELGLLGGIVLLLFFGQIARGLMKVGREMKYPFHALSLGLTAIFCALILESWVTDIMNFRHYWLLLAILAYMVHQVEKPEIEKRP